MNPCDRQVLACLQASGVRGGRADYWLSYRMTFLSQEAIIVAPENGVDRYPSYSALVATLDRVAHVRRSAQETAAPGSPQCRCGDLEAVVHEGRGQAPR